MQRRLWLSLALLATGAGLLATAQLAGASPPTRGIFVVGNLGASVQVDPQVSYISTAWWLEYATAAKLYNWSDRGNRLVPEVASRVVISNGGRTYTFFLRKGFRFSDGTPVTARSFSRAFDRVANHDLASPGAQFITDAKGADIVGAAAVNSGRATHVRGVRVKGRYRLAIRLVRPDQTFLPKLTMPFFQATSSKLPLTHEVVDGYPSAGPYYFIRNDDSLTSLRRNPHWRGRRPAHVLGLDVRWNVNEEAAFQQVEAGQLDETSVPAAEAQGLVDRFGMNRTRFWSMPTTCTGLIALKTHLPLFRRVAMRKAINWAVDRTEYARLAGVAAASPWTHILPPFFPGSIRARKLQPYSARANLANARRLAGDLSNRRIKVAYRTISPEQGELVRQSLVRLGFRAENITMKGYSGGDIYAALGARGSDLDLGVSLGICADTPDPYRLLWLFLNPSYLGGVDSSKYRAKLEAADELREPARTRALGKLDLAITRNLAPAVFMRTFNNRYFFSSRVKPGSLAYSGVYSDWSIPLLAFK
jgi:ABC-type oligopeptide transport system substrate-binding subunit